MTTKNRPPVQLSFLPPSEKEKVHAKRKVQRTAVLRDDLNHLPDVRDGLTREQRVILYTLYEAEKEMGGKRVPPSCFTDGSVNGCLCPKTASNPFCRSSLDEVCP